MSRIGGKNFDVNVGDLQVHVANCTLDITDSTAVAQTVAYMLTALFTLLQILLLVPKYRQMLRDWKGK